MRLKGSSARSGKQCRIRCAGHLVCVAGLTQATGMWRCGVSATSTRSLFDLSAGLRIVELLCIGQLNFNKFDGRVTCKRLARGVAAGVISSVLCTMGQESSRRMSGNRPRMSGNRPRMSGNRPGMSGNKARMSAYKACRL